MEILGIFKDVESAALAVESLVQAGFAEERITSLSSVPYPDGVLVKSAPCSRFRRVSLVGGILGAAAGFLLAAGTSWVYPVQTGDKPIISPFPTGIITYEFAMLFAIIGAMVGMFLEMGLPPRGSRVYDPAISEGFIGIEVSAASEAEAGRAEDLMRRAGALRTTSEGTP